VTEGSAGRVPALEWAGWGLLAVLTATTLLLALLRPTGPGEILNEIRLAAGVDRYAAAMAEGNRLYSGAAAALRTAPEDPRQRTRAYEALGQAVERFRQAREHAENWGEDQRAQIGIGNALYVWARELLKDASGPWYRGNDEATLERAQDLVDEALALPAITGGQRVRLEALRKKIHRAITPWPIL